MSEILKTFTERIKGGPTSFWLILDCSHWYHWTGKKPPVGAEFDCPDCKPPIVVMGVEK